MDENEMASFNATATAESSASGSSNSPVLSKNAQKKLAKRAYTQSMKLEKRAAERVRRREKNQALSKGYADGTLTAEEVALVEKTRELKRVRKAGSKLKDTSVWGGAVVVDLGFDELMTVPEITSLNKQLTYVYAANRTAAHPFATILHTSFSPSASPRMWEKMTKSNWDRWSRCHWWAQDIDVLARSLGADAPLENIHEDEPSGIESETHRHALERHLSGPTLPPTLPPTHKLVYLSADAEEELETLSENEVYIIGGIVDRNRHKMLCQEKAEKLGIRTARLPIGKYIANLPTRKVLTVNQVFDILVQYLALKDWAAAFEAAIPQRKFFESRQAKQEKKRGMVGEDAEAGDNENEHQEEGQEKSDTALAVGETEK